MTFPLNVRGAARRHPVFTTVAQIVAYYQASWYDVSDLTTLFQDAAGTVPVAVDGDPVGLMKDKGPLGIHLSQSVAGSRPTFKTSGGKFWLTRDALDDQLASAANAYPNINYTHYLAAAMSKDVENNGALFGAIRTAVLYHRTANMATGSRGAGGYRAASGAYSAASGATWPVATAAVIDTQCDLSYLDVGVNGAVLTGSSTSIGTDTVGTSTVYDCNTLTVGLNFYGGIAIRARITVAERAVINAFLATKI